MITHGDVLDVLQGTPDEVYHSCFCDPPYGLGFMGKRWDHGVPSCEVWREVWRVLKPGAVLMAFGGTRTWHRLAVNIEDAGFEMFDTLMWLYGSGFPKSQDIGKAIDKEAGQVREAVGRKGGRYQYAFSETTGAPMGNISPRKNSPHNKMASSLITAPATDAARTWQGYGTALKPAHEPVLLFRKPRRATYAQTALQHGTGALWVDGCRVGTNGGTHKHDAPKHDSNGIYGNGLNGGGGAGREINAGRWPANVILDDEAARLLDAQSGERPTGKPTAGKSLTTGDVYGKYAQRSLNGGGDTGGASRFYYCAKASRAEREAGLEGLPLREVAAMQGNLVDGQRLSGKGEPIKTPMGRNNHPCCKPLKLVEYLARLIVPPVEYRDDARLLVPFCGSGSEMIGAYRAGWLHVDGIDNEAGYIEIAERRIAHELSKLEQSEQQLRLI